MDGSMTEVISTTYTKEHCTCYDVYIDGVIKALEIVPDDGYVFKRTFEDCGETVTLYISGYVSIAVGMIEEMFPQFEAILRTDVPEGEYISGITDPKETI